MALSAISLLLALAYPTLNARTFRGLVQDAVAQIETTRVGAVNARTELGVWPASGAPGEIPAELRAAFPADSTLAREGYTLQWSRWEIVEKVEAPRSDDAPPVDAAPASAAPQLVDAVRDVGAITLHSGNDALLAELLGHYGAEHSFVHDTTWTLVVMDGG